MEETLNSHTETEQFSNGQRLDSPLPRGFLRRLGHGITYAFFISLFAPLWCLLFMWGPTLWKEKIMRFMFLEMISPLLLLLATGLIWCLFAPPWVESLYLKFSNSIAFAIIGIGLFTPVVLFAIKFIWTT